MRTDSVAMASGAIGEARQVVGERYGAEFVPERPNAYRTHCGAQEAHEAIRPSSFARTPESLSAHLKPDELRLYDLIWKRALASQMAPARFDQVGVDVTADRYTLHAGARKRIFDGYQALYVEGKDDEEDELTILPDLQDGEPLDLLGLSSEQHFTQPPPRYTEATLIRALEERGIGRPSTYAPTIETIRQRGYVNIKDRRLFPEESAFRVTDLLVEHFPEIVDLDFTARMEDQLDDVAGGEREWVPMVREFWVPFSAKVTEGREKIAKQVEVTDIPCPLTGDKGDMLIKRFGRNGWFWAAPATRNASTPSRCPARPGDPRHAGRGRGLPAVWRGPPGRQAGTLRSVRGLRSLPGVPLHQEEPATRQRAVRHLPAVRPGDGRDQAGPPRTPAVLGLRSLPRLRLRHLDAAGDRRCRTRQCGR